MHGRPEGHGVLQIMAVLASESSVLFGLQLPLFFFILAADDLWIKDSPSVFSTTGMECLAAHGS